MHIPEMGPLDCPPKVITWVTGQEFLAAVKAYRARERQKSEDEADRKVIRRILDQQYMRK
jgi:hypothetical protein